MTDLDLLPYVEFADLAQVASRVAVALPSMADELSLIARRVEEISPSRNRVCHARPLEADDFASVFDAATDLQRTTTSVKWHELSETLHRLDEEPSYVLGLELPHVADHGSSLPNNLPIPEFDDTGFLGRGSDRRELSKLLKSGYPVITLIGEGGVGKSALALRCMYDLLDSESTYEALVWVSLRTRVLTPSGIRQVEEAVESTFGLVRGIADTLGVPAAAQDGDQLLEEVADYLRTFKILLTIDNLETIDLESIRVLLDAAGHGSKILLTSRLGIGQFEVRYPLAPLDMASAAALMRAAARVANLPAVYRGNDDTVRRYCDLLYRNPLLIRWFVAAVANGADAEALLHREGQPFQVVLRFCFENLYERLTPQERSVVEVLAVARRPLTRAELHYLLGHASAEAIDEALGTLASSSMVRRDSDRDAGTTAATATYVLTEIAAEYVDRFAASDEASFRAIATRLGQLSNLNEEELRRVATYRFDQYAVRARTRDERVAAVSLRAALSALSAGDFDSALQHVEGARRILPTYSEAYRIGGLVFARRGELARALDELRTAIELDPRSAIARYTLAQFLQRTMQDFDGALRETARALELEPAEPTLEGFRAWCLVLVGRYPEAAAAYEDRVLPSLNGRLRKWRIAARSQAAECYRRWMEQDRRNGDATAFRQHFGRAAALLQESFGAGDADQSMRDALCELLNQAMAYAAMRMDELLAEQVTDTLHATNAELAGRRDSLPAFDRYWDMFVERPGLRAAMEKLEGRLFLSPRGNEVGSRLRGRVRIRSRQYGFVTDAAEREWYVHRADLVGPEDWAVMRPGATVEFTVGQNREGPCAIALSILTPAQFGDGPGEMRAGEIVVVPTPTRAGVVRDAGGQEWAFPFAAYDGAGTGPTLGERVIFTTGWAVRSGRAIFVEPLAPSNTVPN